MVRIEKIIDSDEYEGWSESWMPLNIVWFVVRDKKGRIRCREPIFKLGKHETPRCMDLFFEREEISQADYEAYFR